MNETSALWENSQALPILQEILFRINAIEENLLKQADNKAPSYSLDTLPVLNWTASKTDLIELIYGLYANRVFNNERLLSTCQLRQVFLLKVFAKRNSVM